MDHKALIGQRVEIPVHYDAWMRGARFGTITAYRNGRQGQSDYLYVKLDKLPARRLKLWRLDWGYAWFELNPNAWVAGDQFTVNGPLNAEVQP